MFLRMLHLQSPQNRQPSPLCGRVGFASRMSKGRVSPGCLYRSKEIFRRAVSQTPLPEVSIQMHRQTQTLRQWRYGLDCPRVRAGVDRVDRILLKKVGDTDCIGVSSGRKRIIIARCPVNLGVAQQEEGAQDLPQSLLDLSPSTDHREGKK